MKLAIISGAGPYAGVVFHKKIIEKYNKLGYYKDKDFPLIQHISYPFHSLDESGVCSMALARQEAQEVTSMLGDASRVFLICNSLLDNFEGVVDTREIINAYLEKNQIKSIYILASQSSIDSEIYKNLHTHIEFPDVKTQEKTTQIIKDVMMGNYSNQKFLELIKEIDHPCILLGCTELCIYEALCNTINVLDLLVDTI